MRIHQQIRISTPQMKMPISMMIPAMSISTMMI